MELIQLVNEIHHFNACSEYTLITVVNLTGFYILGNKSLITNGNVLTRMNPQAFIRLSIGSLGLRVPGITLNSAKSGRNTLSFPCACEIRLRGFPMQTAMIPLVSYPETTPDTNNITSSFYLQESDLKALLVPGYLLKHHAGLEIVVFTGRNGTHCGIGIKRQQIGMFKLEVGPEWGDGKPVILFNGWMHIGKNKWVSGNPGVELHLRVKLDPDPRYIF